MKQFEKINACFIICFLLLFPTGSQAVFLHVGSSDKLSCVEFDGKSYIVKDSAPFKNVQAILLTSGNVLSVGDETGLSAVRFDGKGTYTNVSAASGHIDMEPVKAIAEMPACMLHVLTNRGLSNIEFNLDGSYDDLSAFLELKDPAAIAPLKTGIIFTGHAEGISAALLNNAEYFSPASLYQNTPPVRAIIIGRGGLVHVGHAAGLTAFLYDDNSNTYKPTGFEYAIEDLRAIALDANQNLHVGNKDSLRLLTYDMAGGYHFMSHGQISLPAVNALVVGGDNTIHVGHDGGLMAIRYRADARSYQQTNISIDIPGVRSIVVLLEDSSRIEENSFTIHPVVESTKKRGKGRVQYVSGNTAYGEELVDGVWVGRFWSAEGKIRDTKKAAGRSAFEIQIQKTPSSPMEYLNGGWQFKNHEKHFSDNGDYQYMTELVHDAGQIGLKINTLADDTGALKRWLEITNLSESSIALRDLAVWSGRLWTEGQDYTLGHSIRYDNGHEGWFGWTELNTGVNAFNQERGLGYDDPYFVLRNESSGQYFFGQLAWPVNYTMEFLVQDGLSFRMGPRAKEALRVIESKETLVTPAVHIAHATGDFDNVVQMMHEHVRKSVLLPRPAEQAYKIQCLMPEDRQSRYRGDAYTTENVKKTMTLASAAGMELFIVDGPTWAVGFGNWVPKKTWFPEGLGPLRDFLHNREMLFGLYAEPEGGRGDWTATEAHKNHPEWFEGLLLNMAIPEVAAYVEKEWRDIIVRQKLDLYRHDVNVVLQGQWLVYERDGFKENQYWRHYDRLHDMLLRFQSDYPDVILQQASGGGTRLDLATVGVWDEHFSSDENAYPHVYRMASGMSVFLPPEIVVTPNGMYGPHRQPDLMTTLRGAYALGNTPQIFNQVIYAQEFSEFQPEERVLLLRYANLFKQFIRPMLATCKVYHHEPVNATGSVETGNWFAMEFTSPDKAKGWATVIRLSQEVPATYQLKPRGLDVYKAYKVTFDNSGRYEILDGKTLMDDGLEITIDMKPASELVLFEAQ